MIFTDSKMCLIENVEHIADCEGDLGGSPSHFFFVGHPYLNKKDEQYRSSLFSIKWLNDEAINFSIDF